MNGFTEEFISGCKRNLKLHTFIVHYDSKSLRSAAPNIIPYAGRWRYSTTNYLRNIDIFLHEIIEKYCAVTLYKHVGPASNINCLALAAN